MPIQERRLLLMSLRLYYFKWINNQCNFGLTHRNQKGLTYQILQHAHLLWGDQTTGQVWFCLAISQHALSMVSWESMENVWMVTLAFNLSQFVKWLKINMPVILAEKLLSVIFVQWMLGVQNAHLTCLHMENHARKLSAVIIKMWMKTVIVSIQSLFERQTFNYLIQIEILV